MKYFCSLALLVGSSLVLFAASLVGCTAAAPPAPTVPAEPVQTPSTSMVRAQPLTNFRGDFFTGSGACASCHSGMFDQTRQDVSTDRLWRSTMMANSARDPYWQASMRAEVLAHPEYKELIEDKCASCHMPMARFTAVRHPSDPLDFGYVFEDGFSDPSHGLHKLAMDGVSCSLCHQIEGENFGQHESFSGEYQVNEILPMGRRLAFGPYFIGRRQVEIMQNASGFIPVYSPHMEEAALCATCHVLYTPYFDSNGEIAGEFPEQTIFLEWAASDFRDEQSCQTCHMPLAEGGVRLSTTGGPLRSPFYQHYFVGGNTYMPRILQTFGEEMGVTASHEQFETTIKNATFQLQTQTAAVALEEVKLDGMFLEAVVRVENKAGHKFPSGYPSRRVWLHVKVLDAAGNLVFESGAFDSRGIITGNSHDEDGSRYEPHYLVIEHPDQVQIYESIMVDTENRPTTALLRGTGYVKDNRLLPAGFDKNTVHQDIGVYGEAFEDPDFLAGGDVVRYRVDVRDAQGPFMVEVDLLYQTIGYRWAENLRPVDSEESARFIRYYDSVPNLPVVVSRDIKLSEVKR
jgi:hypothetical protein